MFAILGRQVIQPREAEILRQIADSPIGKKIISDADAARLDERQRLVAEIADLRAEGERRGPQFRARAEEAIAALEKARAEFKLAAAHERDETAKWSNFSTSVQRGVERCQRRLEALADPLISKALYWLAANLNAIRKYKDDPFFCYSPPRAWLTANKKRFAGVPEYNIVSKAHQWAREDAQALIYEAIDKTTLKRRLAEIVASVPHEIKDTWDAE